MDVRVENGADWAQHAAGASLFGLLYWSIPMPKMKTHSGAKKRFKRTGGGKIVARHSHSSHILEKKSPKRKRHFAVPVVVAKADAKRVSKLLGGKG